jgi:hypothetical protein
MQKISLVLVSSVALMLAGCAQDNEGVSRQTVWVADGPPVNCISTNQIRTLRVINDRTIDFEMTGRRVFRNELPITCQGLTFNRGIRYNRRGTQLCSSSSITVNQPGRGWNGPSCPLGRFQPLKRVPAPPAPPQG